MHWSYFVIIVRLNDKLEKIYENSKDGIAITNFLSWRSEYFESFKKLNKVKGEYILRSWDKTRVKLVFWPLTIIVNSNGYLKLSNTVDLIFAVNAVNDDNYILFSDEISGENSCRGRMGRSIS